MNNIGLIEDVGNLCQKGRVGGYLSEGEIVSTLSGRQTSPFPKLDTKSNRKCINTIKRIDNWLRENAINEAAAKGDEFNLLQFKNSNPIKLTKAEKDSMEYYLFE